MTTTCTVYFKRERFSPEGCKASYEANLDWDPFPFGSVLRGNTVLRWPIYKCKDKNWRAQKFESCGFYVPNKVVTKLVKKNIIYVEEGCLYDSTSRKNALIPSEYWEGSCLRCGRCCKNTSGLVKCKYLQEII